MKPFQFEKVATQPLLLPALVKKNSEATVLRLDLLHPIISGNKWYKLRYYLQEAVAQKKKRVITFGGAWSNHILATAAACRQLGLDSAALIRGEQPAVLSATLQQAASLGMQFHFVSREQYREKRIPETLLTPEDYIISEGGAGAFGVRGAGTILDTIDKSNYTHIICAAGTGTTLAGIINSALPDCQVIGIPVLSDLPTIESTIHSYVNQPAARWQLLSGFAWGGYAKHTAALLSFMNEFYIQTGIPTDIVYTAKLFYACSHMIENDFFEKESRLLIIHSGGLQGNRSLPENTLCFGQVFQ
ncbi:MAG: pyridoxal-phosphate dependent enzyme [Chitinophagia bacterium]|nr:pyridoxal-phosphate dependent enzyme [Chitinophagia bacterium]